MEQIERNEEQKSHSEMICLSEKKKANKTQQNAPRAVPATHPGPGVRGVHEDSRKFICARASLLPRLSLWFRASITQTETKGFSRKGKGEGTQLLQHSYQHTNEPGLTGGNSWDQRGWLFLKREQGIRSKGGRGRTKPGSRGQGTSRPCRSTGACQ